MPHSSPKKPKGPALAAPATERHARFVLDSGTNPADVCKCIPGPGFLINHPDYSVYHHGVHFSTRSQKPIAGFGCTPYLVQDPTVIIQLGSVQSTLQSQLGRIFVSPNRPVDYTPIL